MREKLTKREEQIAELFAWGATKKDVANKLFLSVRTVENHARNIFEKLEVTKVNELSAWYFCSHFNISEELSPLKKKVIAYCLLLLVCVQVFNVDNDMLRAPRTSVRTSRTISRKEI